MPTGYTAKLYEGEQSFEAFALGCARAFGALIDLRDAGPDAEIPEAIEPSPYHLEAMGEASERMAEIQSWSALDAEKLAEDDYYRRVEEFGKSKRIREARSKRYAAMVERVRGWEPPNEDFVQFKDFMESQLVESASFDCDYRMDPPTKLSGVEYTERELERARRDLHYHAKEWEKEQERARERTKWIRALRESLAEAAPA